MEKCNKAKNSLRKYSKMKSFYELHELIAENWQLMTKTNPQNNQNVILNGKIKHELMINMCIDALSMDIDSIKKQESANVIDILLALCHLTAMTQDNDFISCDIKNAKKK